MFTGLIEKICVVKSARRSGDSMLLGVDLGELANGSRIGDSIAINGACLTITGLEGGLASFDLSAETLSKSALGELKPSSQVNVERAIKATDRFGGHFVLGHIDGTATIKTMERRGEFADITFAAAPELLEAMIAKGSVAVDGISLTIASMDRAAFTVSVIPETIKRTTLGKAQPGERVNIETDMIVKTIKRQLEEILPKKQRLSAERLRELGF